CKERGNEKKIRCTFTLPRTLSPLIKRHRGVRRARTGDPYLKSKMQNLYFEGAEDSPSDFSISSLAVQCGAQCEHTYTRVYGDEKQKVDVFKNCKPKKKRRKEKV
ncbi:hypothetical protein X777_09028, partial [Ooceraea biroi]